MIKLPKEWTTYSDAIRDRCRDLIEYTIWNGIELHMFDKWRKNFKTDEEKYFASCVLDSLIYKSNQQTYALIKDNLSKNLVNQFRLLDLGISDFPNSIINPLVDPLIRFVPVITQYDPGTKSSNEILRFMKRHFHVSESWIIHPWKIEEELASGNKTIIFIDDFLGTGQQFDDAISNVFNLDKLIQKHNVIYAPLVAHEKGIEFLNKLYPNLKIVSAERLDYANHSFFTRYFEGEEVAAKKFYVDMLRKRGINLGAGNEYGHGNLEITLAFEHAAPDNSLQLLTYRTDNWSPLFNR